MATSKAASDGIEPEKSKDTSEVGASPAELLAATELLERLVEDRAQLLVLDRQQQQRLLKAAGQVAHPGRAARRQIVRAERMQRRQAEKQRKSNDEFLLNQTAIRSNHRPKLIATAPPAPFAETRPPRSDNHNEEQFIADLSVARNCYICKEDYRRLHFFYDSLCPDCAQFNWAKRNATADLTGRTALLTGGRVKIGFEAALKLLRGGCEVVVTTRFPHDASLRFAETEDYDQWQDRLQIYGLDLRNSQSVEQFTDHLMTRLPRLDFILNNACQTIRRPPAYYEHLMATERQERSQLPSAAQPLVASYHELLAGRASQAKPRIRGSKLTDGNPVGEQLKRAAELSQLALITEDQAERGQLFPQQQYDSDKQQIDLRAVNSWRLKLAEVSTVEMLEVQLVNAVAPFILNARLKPLMMRSGQRDLHIVNVSAMEGVFYRAFKRDTHPHTNMAKAALNMMTRTSAVDYAQDGIHMNSVDTGWITDEDPIEITQRKQRERGFSTPLDTVDAAARICNPIIDGLNTGNHQWGKFWKDYQISNW